MPINLQDRPASREGDFVRLLANLFRRAGWRIVRELKPGPEDWRPDLVVDSGDKKYIIEVKRAPESRRDRLIPLLSQAILQAQSAARQFPESVAPVAVVVSKHIPDSAADQVKQFAMRHVPSVGIGMIDSEGFRVFFGYGLEAFNSERSGSSAQVLSEERWRPSHIFSDLNQWMLKILLSANIPESLLSAPRARCQNATQLAQAADVSVMSASRFLRQLLIEGFLDVRKGWLRLVRTDELMKRWLNANPRSVREVPAHWIIRGREEQISLAVRSYVAHMDATAARPRKSREGRLPRVPPRICLGLYAAADALGFGFVRGVPPYLYLERLESEALKLLGLSTEDADRHPDVYLRIPQNDEAIFRALVRQQGVPVSDIIQVWLDVSNHPARGKEQAEEIWRRVLAPAIHKAEE